MGSALCHADTDVVVRAEGARAGPNPDGPQRRTFVLPAEAARLLQNRDHRVGELVEPTRGHVGHQDEPVRRLLIDGLHDQGGDLSGSPHERAGLVTSIISSRMDSFLASASARTGRPSSAVPRLAARPCETLGDSTSGSDSGNGPSGSYDERSRIQTCSKREWPSDRYLLACDVGSALDGVLWGVAEDERRSGKNLRSSGDRP